MNKKHLIILKIGGFVITDKKHDNEKINRTILKRISHEISLAQKETNYQCRFINKCLIVNTKTNCP